MALRDVPIKSASFVPCPDHDLSEADIQLITQLFKEDEDELLGLKGKETAGVENLQAARMLWEHEIRLANQHSNDRALALSLNNAIASDQHVINAIQDQENIAQQDRALAVLLDQNPDADLPEIEVDDPFLQSDLATQSMCEMMSNLGMASIHQDNPNEVDTHASSSSSGAAHKNTRCVACMESMLDPPMYLPACNHRWCRDCLRELFLGATKDEELFPPRCCNNIFPPGLALRMLEYNELARFSIKGIEFSSTNRLYCANPTCSTFIPPWCISGERAQCHSCHRTTHTACRALGEPGHVCPPDEADQQLLALGEQEGWRRCSQCRVMVELRLGCNHMTCRCGKEFCYACGADWRTCECPIWHEDRLMDVAHRVVDNEVGPQAEHQERAAALVRVVEELRAHEIIPCEHHRSRQWRWRNSGDLECDLCSRTMPEYIFDCRRCGMSACYRCRLNRLH